jgi:hypothetical protein
MFISDLQLFRISILMLETDLSLQNITFNTNLRRIIAREEFNISICGRSLKPYRTWGGYCSVWLKDIVSRTCWILGHVWY